MEKIYRAYINEEITMEGFGRHYRPLEERLKQIDNQIPEVQGEIDFLKSNISPLIRFSMKPKTFIPAGLNLLPEEKRKIIENITEKIIIGKEDVTINLTYLPSSLELMADEQRNVRDSWPRPA